MAHVVMVVAICATISLWQLKIQYVQCKSDLNLLGIKQQICRIAKVDIGAEHVLAAKRVAFILITVQL